MLISEGLIITLYTRLQILIHMLYPLHLFSNEEMVLVRQTSTQWSILYATIAKDHKFTPVTEVQRFNPLPTSLFDLTLLGCVRDIYLLRRS